MGRINYPLSAPPILADVGAPTVTPVGQDDTAGWEYAVVGIDFDGARSQVSSNGTTAVGADNLSDINYNTVTWTDVAGYKFFEIFRLVTADSNIGTGLVAKIGGGVQTFDDVGHRAVPATASAANTTGDGKVVDLTQFSGVIDVDVASIGTGTYEVQSSVDNALWVLEGAELTADGARTVTSGRRWARMQCTAFTSGTPTGLISGEQNN